MPTMKEMIQRVSIKVITHHPKNPRLHDERNLQAIMRSLKEFQQLAPLVVWGKKNYVIAGNGRLEAMRRLGKKEVEVLRADHLTEEQALAYMIADNKTTDLSEFDFQQVAEIMGGLQKKRFDLGATGFADFEVEPLLQGEWSPPEVAEMPEASVGRFVVVFSEEQSEWVRGRLEELRGEGEKDDDVFVRLLEA